MEKKVMSLFLLLVGIIGTNYAQSLWELIPLYPMLSVDIPGLVAKPGIRPLSTEEYGKMFIFEAERNENEVVVTTTENVSDVRVIVVDARGIVVYSNAINHIVASDIIRISTIGWNNSEYMICIICGNDAIGGEFSV